MKNFSQSQRTRNNVAQDAETPDTVYGLKKNSRSMDSNWVSSQNNESENQKDDDAVSEKNPYN
jgi:hypothetical protein